MRTSVRGLVSSSFRWLTRVDGQCRGLASESILEKVYTDQYCPPPLIVFKSPESEIYRRPDNYYPVAGFQFAEWKKRSGAKKNGAKVISAR